MSDLKGEVEREVGALVLANVQLRAALAEHERNLAALAARLRQPDVSPELLSALTQAHPGLLRAFNP